MNSKIKIGIDIFNMCSWVIIAVSQVVIGEIFIPVFLCAVIVIIAYAFDDIFKEMLSNNMS